MIIKTLHVVCDHDGCERFSEGERGVSQALPLIRQIRALGWVASDGRQYCPEHIDMADVAAEWLERQPRPEPGVTYRTVKGALLGPGSGIETAEQAERIVNALRGRPTDTHVRAGSGQ